MAIQAFFRPIEVTAANDGYRARLNAGAWSVLALAQGVYPSLLSLLHHMRAQLGGALNPNIVAGFRTSNRVAFGINTGATLQIEFLDLPLGHMLGWYADTTADAVAITADDVPSFAWFPSFQSADQARFSIDQQGAWAGGRAKNGVLSGTSTGPDVYARPFTFEHQAGYRCFRSAQLRATPGDSWDADRCFEDLIKRARTAYTNTAGEPHPKGIYYVPDMGHYRFATDTPAVDAQPPIPATMDSGGVCHDIIYSVPPALPEPDRYVYGFCSEAGSPNPSASVPRARQWYEVTMEFHTAPAPTWTAP